MPAQAIVHFVRNGGVTSVGRLVAQMKYLSRRAHGMESRQKVQLTRSKRYFDIPIEPEEFDQYARDWLEGTGRLRPHGEQQLTTHIVASFPEGVDRDRAHQIADNFVWELFGRNGDADHQDEAGPDNEERDDDYDYFTAFHTDTDNAHIHIIINRDPFVRVHARDDGDRTQHFSTDHHMAEWLRISHRNPDINWDSMRERFAHAARDGGIDLVATPRDAHDGPSLTQAEYWRRHRENIDIGFVDGDIDYEPQPHNQPASAPDQMRLGAGPDGQLRLERPGSASGAGPAPTGTVPQGGSGSTNAGIGPAESGSAGPSRVHGSGDEAAEDRRIQRWKDHLEELANQRNATAGVPDAEHGTSQHGGASGGGTSGHDGGIDQERVDERNRQRDQARDAREQEELDQGPGRRRVPRAPSPEQSNDFADDIYDATPRQSPEQSGQAAGAGQPAGASQHGGGSGGGSMDLGDADGGAVTPNGPIDPERRAERELQRRRDGDRRDEVDTAAGPSRRRTPAGVEDVASDEEAPRRETRGQAVRRRAAERRRRTEVELLTEGQAPLSDADLARGVETRAQQDARLRNEEAARIAEEAARLRGAPSTTDMTLRDTAARQERAQRIQQEAAETVRQRQNDGAPGNRRNQRSPRRGGRGRDAT